MTIRSKMDAPGCAGEASMWSPGSIILSKEFLTENPTAYTLRSSVLFPDPSRRFSCRAAISTCSLSSSSLMTVVFLASLVP